MLSSNNLLDGYDWVYLRLILIQFFDQLTNYTSRLHNNYPKQLYRIELIFVPTQSKLL